MAKKVDTLGNFMAIQTQAVENKLHYHRLGRTILKQLAAEINLGDGVIRNQRGGPAVAGEIVLHVDSYYVMLSASVPGEFLWRLCKSKKDFTGGTNHWEKLTVLRDLPAFAAQIRAAVEAEQRKQRKNPIMEEWRKHKEKNADKILLFRVGDFYETFNEDALTLQGCLGVGVTYRESGGARVSMSGFPYQALEMNLRKLLEAGFKVAVLEPERRASVTGNAEYARGYEKSVSEIEWTCCPGIVCGSAGRTGLDASTGLAIYRLTGFRHPSMTGMQVVVDRDGTLLRSHSLEPVKGGV